MDHPGSAWGEKGAPCAQPTTGAGCVGAKNFRYNGSVRIAARCARRIQAGTPSLQRGPSPSLTGADHRQGCRPQASAGMSRATTPRRSPARANGHPGAEDGAALPTSAPMSMVRRTRVRPGPASRWAAVETTARPEGQGVVADGDRGHVEHHAVAVEEHRSPSRMFAVVAEERRLQPPCRRRGRTAPPGGAAARRAPRGSRSGPGRGPGPAAAPDQVASRIMQLPGPSWPFAGNVAVVIRLQPCRAHGWAHRSWSV